jgi:hypothetical protein
MTKTTNTETHDWCVCYQWQSKRITLRGRTVITVANEKEIRAWFRKHYRGIRSTEIIK